MVIFDIEGRTSLAFTGLVQKFCLWFSKLFLEKITVFPQTFQSNIYLFIYQQKTLKSTFNDKISQTVIGIGSLAKYGNKQMPE